MARIWVTYRSGLRILGRPVAEVPLEKAARKLDLAPWRLFSATAPDEVDAERLASHPGPKRVLVEVAESEREELCGFPPGFYESPYSPEECLRRLGARLAA
jgi:hypothetical protein